MRIINASLAAMAMLWIGCQGDDPQVLRGRVATGDFRAPVLGVRAVRGIAEVSVAQVDARGYFELSVPPGTQYRLEVITRDGAHRFVQREEGSPAEHTFDVCHGVAPFDMGHVHSWGKEGDSEDGTDHNCDVPDDPPCSDNDPDCSVEPEKPCWCNDPVDPGCPSDDPGCDKGCPPEDPGCNSMCDKPNPDGTCGDPTDPMPGGTDGCDPQTMDCSDKPPVCSDGSTNCEEPLPCDGMNCPGGTPMCDNEGKCCYDDGTCCDSSGTCCYADGTCAGPQPCLPDKTGQCTDPCADGKCEPNPGECDQWMCDPCKEDPMSCWPEEPNCPMDDPSCWPKPEGPPECIKYDDGSQACYEDAALPERPFVGFGCVGG